MSGEHTSKPTIEVSVNNLEQRLEPFELAFAEAGYGIGIVSYDPEGDSEDSSGWDEVVANINGVPVYRAPMVSLDEGPEKLLGVVNEARSIYKNVVSIMGANVKSNGFQTENDYDRGVLGIYLSDILMTEVVFTLEDLAGDYEAMTKAIIESLRQNVKSSKRVFDIPEQWDRREVEAFKRRLEQEVTESADQEVNGTVAARLNRQDMARKKRHLLVGPEKGGKS